MSSNAKRMPEINLEDFERRLRAAGSAPGAVEDPLEELTRLVNTIASERPAPPDRVVEISSARAPRPLPAAPPPPAPELELEPEYIPEADPTPASLPASVTEPPMLRSSFEETPEPATEEIDSPEFFASEPSAAIAAQQAARRPSWYLRTGGLTALALVMAAGAGYWKLHGTGIAGTGAPPMIMAADGPTKVAPPDEKGVQSPSDSGALLTKDSSSYGGVKVVNNQEEPLDVAMKGDSPVAMTRDTPIIPQAAPLPLVQPATPAAVDASRQPSAPAPQASAPAPAASATPNPPPVAAPVAQKKGPKTVTVRPDGTLVTADAGSAAQAPAAAAPAPQPSPATRASAPLPSVQTQASSPSLDLPPAPKPAKTSARVNVAKVDTTAPTDSVAQPLQTGSVQPEKKLPTKLAPPEKEANAAPAAAAPAAGGGEWAVQLAAPRSEADAQSAIQRLQTKYASALGDSELAVHKAEVNGDTIYRVRASGLSKADAQALCQKLKADGGQCFVARN